MSSDYKINLLRADNRNLGLRQDGKSYIIGFPFMKDVKKVRSVAHINTRFRLIKQSPTDVTLDINEGLRDMGIKRNVSKVITDEAAHLYISKKININKQACNIEQIYFSEFIMMPFTKHMGIIMPTDLLDETEKELVYEVQVVDPSVNIDFFRDSLVI